MKSRLIPAILLTLKLLTGQASAQVSVTATAGMGPTSYTTLKGAFDAINTGTHRAAVTVTITGNTTETASAVLNASGSGSASYTSVSIKPSGGAARTISGFIPNGALIRFNGADNVTLDGSLNGSSSRDLTITNTSTAAPTVIALVSLGIGAGATNDVVKNCNLSSGITPNPYGISIGYGISVGGNTPGTQGADNDNVTLQNNAITEAPIGIYAYGTASVNAGGNNNLSIIGNLVAYLGDQQSIGIRLGNTLDSSVSQNTVSEQTSAKGSTPTAISLETGFVSSLVSRNIVTKSLNTFSSGGRGITVGTGTAASALTISNNVIYGVNGANYGGLASSPIGIVIGTVGNSELLTTVTGGINLYFNSVSMTGSVGAATAAIYIGSGASALDIRNNVFANTRVSTNFSGKNYAIYSDAPSTAFTTINSNDYFVSNTFNAASAIPGFLGSDRLGLAGIQAGFGQNANSITADPVFNNPMSNLLPPPSSPIVNSGTSLSGSVLPYVDITGATRVDPPSMGAYEIGIDVTPPAITYTPLLNTAGTGNRTLTATITDATGVPISGTGLPVLYWKINVGNYSAAQGTSLGGGQYQFTFGSGVAAAYTVSYYLVAQDTVTPTPMIVASPAAGAAGFTTSPPAVATPPTTPNIYRVGAISGTKIVGAGGSYATLTAAVADLNAKVLTGPVTLILADATYPSETFPIIINVNAGSSATNTITIKPSTTTTISGAVANGALIKLNGASWVTIDGSKNGTTSRDLTITNTASTAQTVIALVSLGTGAGATNDVIKNCNLSTGEVNYSLSSNVGYGITVGGSTPGAPGADNDNITIQNNAITAVPYGIYAVGTASVSTGGDDNLSIIGNSVEYNGTQSSIGIRVGNALNSSVSQNTVSVRSISTATGISLETGFVSSSVTRNTVIKSVVVNSGGDSGRGITIGTGTTTSALTIANNVIHGVNGSNSSNFGCSSMGIAIGTVGNSSTLTTTTGGINLYFNSVSMTGSMGYEDWSSQTAAIYVGSGASALDIRNNVFANTQMAISTAQKNYAIYSAAAGTAFTTINFNDYFVSNAFNAASAIPGFLAGDRVNLAGIQAGFGQNTNSIAADPVFNNSATSLRPFPVSPLVDIGTSLIGTVSPYVDITGATRVDPPSMGAYEIGGDDTPPTITYTLLPNTAGTGNRTLSATITHPVGVPTSGMGLPVLYWKINASAYSAAPGTSLGGGQYQFTFGSGVVAGNTVSYYLVAQSTVTPTPFVGASPAAGAAGLTAGPPTAATPPTTPHSYRIAPISGIKTVGSGGNYPTLTAAVATLNASVLTGPVTLILTDATYPNETFPIVINANEGSSATNTITIRPSATTTISGSIGGFALIKLNGASWVVIDGSNNGTTSRNLTITNTSTFYPTAISLESLGAGLGATHDVIKNCNLSTGIATTIGYGISVGGSTPGTTGTTGADNDNVTLQNNAITAAPVGIYARGEASVSAGGNDNLSIVGNSIDYNGTQASMGIQVGNALNSSVSQNTVSQQSSTFAAAISLETGFVSSSVTRNTITKSLTNYLGAHGGRGITVGTGTASSALTIANNVIYGVNGSNSSSFGFTSMGIAIGTIGYDTSVTTTAGGIKLYSNSVSMTGSMGDSFARTAAIYIGSGTSALDIRNNVFANTQVGTSTNQKNYAIYSAGASTAFTTINYNDYFVSNTFNAASAIPGFLGSNRVNLAGIQAGFGQNVNSFTADPVFTSATDLHITSLASPVSNTGTPLAGVLVDFDGMTRSATTPDIGAYEFNSPPIVAAPTQTAVTSTSASIGGNVIGDGGSAVTERGVVYSITATNSDPLIGGTGVTKATSGGTTGGLTVNAAGLAQATEYSFKAYATNGLGTTYTNPVATFTTLTRYTEWAAANGISGPNSAPGECYLGDGIPNLLKFAFGIPPTTPGGLGTIKVNGATLSAPGGPAVVSVPSGSGGTDHLAMFARRLDRQTSGITYSVAFSADLTSWVTSNVSPTSVANDGAIEAVTVPYPALVNGLPPKFFHIKVSVP